MAELRPGGLAVITRANHPENVGSEVELVGPVPFGRVELESCWVMVDPDHGPCWHVRPINGPLVAGSFLSGRLKERCEGVVPGAWLMPLGDGDPDAVVEQYDEEVPA